MPLALKLPHLGFLVLGQHLGHHLPNAQLPLNGRRRAGVVAGEHNHCKAHTLQLFDGRAAGGLHRVGRGHNPQQGAPAAKIKGRFALAGQGVGHFAHPFQ